MRTIILLLLLISCQKLEEVKEKPKQEEVETKDYYYTFKLYYRVGMNSIMVYAIHKSKYPNEEFNLDIDDSGNPVVISKTTNKVIYEMVYAFEVKQI